MINNDLPIWYKIGTLKQEMQLEIGNSIKTYIKFYKSKHPFFDNFLGVHEFNFLKNICLSRNITDILYFSLTIFFQKSFWFPVLFWWPLPLLWMFIILHKKMLPGCSSCSPKHKFYLSLRFSLSDSHMTYCQLFFFFFFAAYITTWKLNLIWWWLAIHF